LDGILRYLAEVNPQAALRYAENFTSTAQLIGFMPEIFRVWEVNPRFRCCSSILPYLMIYHIDPQAEAVIITRLIHGHQNTDFMQ
jgi:hypothetical protein